MQQIIGSFVGFSEFPDASVPYFNDACGPDAILMAEHVLQDRLLNSQDLANIRTGMEQRGLFKPGGCTLGNCHGYMIDRGYAIDAYAPYGSPQAAIHTIMRQYAGISPLVVQVLAAHNLPDNEQNVNSHFVAVGGIDSMLGYLTGNGDDIMALAAHGGHGKVIPLRWVTWQQFVGASIAGVFAVSNPPPPQPRPLT